MTDHAEALAKALEELAAERRCTAVMAGRANRAEAELAAYRSRPAAEVVAWEATTGGYKQFVTDAQYRKFSAEARRWYKPYRCSNCVATPALAGTEPAGEVVEAARAVIEQKLSTYKARNGREVGIQDENGEKCWIVPFDEMFALESALRDQSEA